MIAWGSRPVVRRLVLIVLMLAAVDALVRPLLARFEHARYEGSTPFRFENSDLFGLGPLVEYLNEHPRGERPRTVFVGNSVIWGYGLAAHQALPAQYEALDSSHRVYNVAINGFDTGNAFLIAKAMGSTIDRLYVLLQGGTAHARLPDLIPIAADDAQRFRLTLPSRIEQRLRDGLSVWQLYRHAYRLQMAMFGTSTRQFIYLNKSDWVRSLVGRSRAAQAQTADVMAGGVVLRAPALLDGEIPDAQPGERAGLLWSFAELARLHDWRVTFLHLPGYSHTIPEADIPAFNAISAPYARVVIADIDRAMTFDGQHLTAAGARTFAQALLDFEREGGDAPR